MFAHRNREGLERREGGGQVGGIEGFRSYFFYSKESKKSFKKVEIQFGVNKKFSVLCTPIQKQEEGDLVAGISMKMLNSKSAIKFFEMMQECSRQERSVEPSQIHLLVLQG
eukprot:TRINITY_DN84_c0_g1_i3.p7 TRINITY_DN84_c0_g1~~TRINITY_DN84_c0_g1_i3.p7  ORF type:complete len:111 (+),score=8.13 TRINITY_DN84_c0_g1_i3:189-521(+)